MKNSIKLRSTTRHRSKLSSKVRNSSQKLIEGYRTNLLADGKILDQKYSIAELENLKVGGLTNYVSAIKNAQATIASQKVIYGLVHTDMMQEGMNETAPKVPESTSDSAFSMNDFADTFCNYDASECTELLMAAQKKAEADNALNLVKTLN